MINRNSSMKTENREHMRGGPGTVTIKHIVDKEQLPHGRLFAEITLEPGDGIGPHIHEGEVEYYYLLTGKGIVGEDDGEKQVGPGDVVITGNGASHRITNTGSVTMKFIALIILN